MHVRLGDMNDHSPVFEREEFEVRVSESALVNTPLTQLKVSRCTAVWEPSRSVLLCVSPPCYLTP